MCMSRHVYMFPKQRLCRRLIIVKPVPPFSQLCQSLCLFLQLCQINQIGMKHCCLGPNTRFVLYTCTCTDAHAHVHAHAHAHGCKIIAQWYIKAASLESRLCKQRKALPQFIIALQLSGGVGNMAMAMLSASSIAADQTSECGPVDIYDWSDAIGGAAHLLLQKRHLKKYQKI